MVPVEAVVKRGREPRLICLNGEAVHAPELVGVAGENPLAAFEGGRGDQHVDHADRFAAAVESSLDRRRAVCDVAGERNHIDPVGDVLKAVAVLFGRPSKADLHLEHGERRERDGGPGVDELPKCFGRVGVVPCERVDERRVKNHLPLRLAFVDPDERTRQKAAENLLDEVHLSETWRTTDGTDAAAVAVELADELAATDGFGDRTATTIAERETVKAVLGDALDT